MKLLVGLILVFVTVIIPTHQDPDDVEKYWIECAEELKLDPVLMLEIDKSKRFEGLNKDQKCVLRCVMQKQGAIDEDGNMILDETDKRILKNLHIDESKCVPPTNVTDQCERVYLMTKCVYELAEDLI